MSLIKGNTMAIKAYGTRELDHLIIWLPANLTCTGNEYAGVITPQGDIKDVADLDAARAYAHVVYFRNGETPPENYLLIRASHTLRMSNDDLTILQLARSGNWLVRAFNAWRKKNGMTAIKPQTLERYFGSGSGYEGGPPKAVMQFLRELL